MNTDGTPTQSYRHDDGLPRPRPSTTFPQPAPDEVVDLDAPDAPTPAMLTGATLLRKLSPRGSSLWPTTHSATLHMNKVLSIAGLKGKMATIDLLTGAVEFGENYDLEEAAKSFWISIGNLCPAIKGSVTDADVKAAFKVYSEEVGLEGASGLLRAKCAAGLRAVLEADRKSR